LLSNIEKGELNAGNGVKDDGWIYQLNIGNVMQLNPIKALEILRLDQAAER
jgi:hypothetical protein